MLRFRHTALALPIFVVALSSCSIRASRGMDDMPMNTETFVSHTGDKAIDFSISDHEKASFPDWNPDQAPPLSIPEVLAIAAKELPKYTHGNGEWHLESVRLERLDGPAPSGTKDKWIYAVSYELPDHHGDIQIPITLAGVPIQGKERPIDKRDEER